MLCVVQVVDKHGNLCYDIRSDVDVELTLPPGLDTGIQPKPKAPHACSQIVFLQTYFNNGIMQQVLSKTAFHVPRKTS